MLKVVVLGGGINGASCALKIKERFKDFQVTLIADQLSPDTTGDGSGGLWLPYLCGNTPKQLLRKWGIETYQYMHGLWLDGGHDVSVMPIYSFYTTSSELYLNEWTEIFGYQRLDEQQLEYYNKIHSNNFVAGEVYTTFTVYSPSMIQYLYKQFEINGGKIQKLKVSSLEDQTLREYDVIVNCTGLGAKCIVPDDGVHPIRGQVIKVLAPWHTSTVITDEGYYVIPNNHNCVMGGTHQEHNYSTVVDDNDAKSIKAGCSALLPSFKHAEVLNHWVGLRPCRNEVRIEKELRNGKLVVHNYGHGGSGLTLFWGCASEVLNILEESIIHKTKLHSKI